MENITKLTDEKLKELGLKLYIMEPRTKTFGGIKITKDTEFTDVEELITESEDKLSTRSVIIEQKLSGFILETKITSKLNIPGFDTEEVKVSKQDLSLLGKEELLLVFVNEEGWGVPDAKMITPEKAITTLELLKNKGE